MISRRLRVGLFIVILLVSTSCTAPLRPSNDDWKLPNTKIEPGAVRERYSVITYEREIGKDGVAKSFVVEGPSVLATEPDKGKCKLYRLPDSELIPKLPRLTEEERNDPELAGLALLRHITELRNHINKREHELNKSYGKYRDDCQ